MKVRVTILATLLVALIAIPGAIASEKTTYYLSLGDSFAMGRQPIGGPAGFQAPPGYNQGYADQLLKLVRDRYEQLQLEKLGCGGESTRTLIEGAAWCPYPAGSQLAEAEVFLRAHAAETVVVTLTVGVNDVLGTEATCVEEATLIIDLGCIQGQVPSIQANIREIVRRLRAAAPGVRIIGSNYFNPLVGAWVLVPGPIGEFVAHASVGPVGVLNAAIEAAYAQESVAIADLYAAFASGSFDDAVSSEWGVVPVNAANVCAWTWFCSARYPGNIHPNTDGHGIIARAFAEELAP